jgi:hypothetical protein
VRACVHACVPACVHVCAQARARKAVQEAVQVGDSPSEVKDIRGQILGESKARHLSHVNPLIRIMCGITYQRLHVGVCCCCQ